LGATAGIHTAVADNVSKRYGTSHGKFVLHFVCYLVVFYLAISKLVPDFYLSRLIDFTIYLVMLLSKALGIGASAADAFVSISGFMLEIHMDCIAIQYLPIFFAAMLAYPLHGFRYKLAGLFAASVIILFVNITRIISLGVIGANFNGIFNFVHEYFWPGLFVIFLCALWLLWARGRFLSSSFVKYLSVASVAAVGAYYMVGLIIEPYIGALAFLADGIMLDISVSAEDGKILYFYSGTRHFFSISTDIYDSVIFLALMAASVNFENALVHLKKALAGMGILSGLHLALVLLGGIIVMNEVPRGQVLDFLVLIRTLSITAPVALWFYFARGFEKLGSIRKGFQDSMAEAA
jgi:exosortase/archaeosortase family protein